MRIFKKIGIVLAFGAVGTMLLGTTVCAKANVNGLNVTKTNFAIFPELNETQKQLYEYCRVYDPNRVQYYDATIRDMANQYVSYGYKIFDLYSMFYYGFPVSPQAPNSNLPLSLNGFNVLDSVEHPTFSGVFMKVSRSDYEAYSGVKVHDRTISISKSTHSDTYHCTFTDKYDPQTEILSHVVVCDSGYTLR